VGETLTAVITALNGTGTPSYQWKRGETPIGTAGTYSVQLADVGSTITVTVTYSGNSGSQTSGATATVPPVLSGTVSISGAAAIGETLTAVTSALEGEGAVTYQWKRAKDGTSTEIGTNSTYVIQAEDLGSTITVTVTRSGYTGSKTSEPTAAVALPDLTGTVSITGTAEVGQTLTAITTSLGGSGGTISYQWKRGGTDIGTNNSTYAIVVADVSSTITVTVTRSGYSGSITSDPTVAVFEYAIGATGPGGGKIFYRKDSFSDGWRYLEAAPADLGGTLAWASSGYTNTDIAGATGTAIGTGKANTAAILAVDANAPAAKACADYRGGGFSDWFLPSREEMTQVWNQRTTIGGQTGTYYWSSSQRSSTMAFYLSNYNGQSSGDIKNSSGSCYVRPIRQF
jgi:uncharacterized protein YaiE (UPF0345 family)